MDNWIAEEDMYTRMWKCPYCSRRVVGHPMNFSTKNYNPYFYCPYCGEKLKDNVQDSIFDMED